MMRLLSVFKIYKGHKTNEGSKAVKYADTVRML